MGEKAYWIQLHSTLQQLFDKDRTQLGTIYVDSSCLTWEGLLFQEKTAMVSCLVFHSRKSSTASQGRTISPHQIAASSARLWASCRLMKTLSWDSTRFLLKMMFLLIKDASVCTNDMFTLALHNFSWPPPNQALMLFPPLFSSRYDSQSSRGSK
uniref:Uncharacterized protein n=1 Tax=Neovison vison TaxID=452646 RepID=A0A8C7B465_NEOVI